MIKCPIGYYNEEENVFYVELGKHKVTTQDLADCISIAHSAQVQKDQAYRKEHEKEIFT